MADVLTKDRLGKRWIAPESFFLGRPLRRGVRHKLWRFGNLADDANVRSLVTAMYSRHFPGEYWRLLAEGSGCIPQEDMLNRLLASDRSPKAIYSALLHRPGCQVVGDKSGPHLYHLPRLLEWFPDARIVHTFRDPRAILASRLTQDRTVRAAQARGPVRALVHRCMEPLHTLSTLLYITIYWRRAARLHHRYQVRYPSNYRLSKFEDLVREPEESVRALAGFVGIEFDAAMLQPVRLGSAFRPDGEAGFDPQALVRWRQYLEPWMEAWLVFWTRPYLELFGYEKDRTAMERRNSRA
jgi:hypothetical protein